MSTNSSEEINAHKESQPFQWKLVASLLIIIMASTLVLYGYQRFQQHEAQEQKALLDAIQKAEIAQRNADEAAKQILQIQDQILKQDMALETMREALTQERIQLAQKKRPVTKVAQTLTKPKKAKAFDDSMELWRNTGGVPMDLRR
jgi:hypothetical protein